METKRIRLILINPAEATARMAALTGSGYVIEYEPPSQALFRKLRNDPPDVFVIDLSRQPSGGRDIAVQMRTSPSTAAAPIVFAGGQPEKVDAVRSLFPDAIFTTWEDVLPALNQALLSALTNPNPVTFEHGFAAYSGTPLAKKLGIKPGMRLTLLDAPPDATAILAPLPEGVQLLHGDAASPASIPAGDLLLWFVKTPVMLAQVMPGMAAITPEGGLWVLWPKKSSRQAVEGLNERAVREAGLAHHLVDYKICSVSDVWSGLKFAVR